MIKGTLGEHSRLVRCSRERLFVFYPLQEKISGPQRPQNPRSPRPNGTNQRKEKNRAQRHLVVYIAKKTKSLLDIGYNGSIKVMRGTLQIAAGFLCYVNCPKTVRYPLKGAKKPGLSFKDEAG